jgi:hypothetical protein
MARVIRRFGALVFAFGAMLVLSACAGKTTGATNINDGSATLHATARCDSGETCRWYWEYWPTGQARLGSVKTPVQGPVTGPTGTQMLSTNITGLTPGTIYRWVFCASPNDGGVYACAGPNGTFGSTTADPPPDFGTFTTAFPGTLAERWNGKRWRILPAPNPSGSTSVLKGVSCTSARACTAVGGSGGLTLAERWDGTAWTIQPTPNPTGATSSVLNGVSCTSATGCTAVGNSTTSGNTTAPLAERWDGTAWTIQTTPNPTGASSSVLSGVSCTSAAACTAVGNYINSAFTQLTLAERWDGMTWTIQPTPNPAPQPESPYSALSGVSCTSATACTTVGSSGSIHSTGDSLTLAEAWDGTSWTIQPTPNPFQTYSVLAGVSCTSATACTAAGSPDFRGATVLAEAWDGTRWTIQPTPNPSGTFGALSDVSCTSAGACTAVGSYFNSANTRVTLAERWDGTTWAIQPTPNASGAVGSDLSGVSCTSTTKCTAVGSQ